MYLEAHLLGLADGKRSRSASIQASSEPKQQLHQYYSGPNLFQGVHVIWEALFWVLAEVGKKHS